MDPNAGRWLLISDGTEENIRRFFKGCWEQFCETKGVVIVPTHEKMKELLSSKISWQQGWTVAVNPGKAIQKEDQWVGLLWDDQCPESPQWDVRLIQQVHPWNVVTSLEAVSGDWRCGAVVWGRECLKAGGGIDFKNIDQCLIDWSNAGSLSKCWYLERSVQLPRRIGPTERAFSTPDSTETAEKLKDLMSHHGVRTLEPDWTGVSLQICMPSMASRPEAMCMISMYNTVKELEKAGVTVEWAMERYNADIGLARSHILSEFIRSRHTHLLMVDDDMTWEFQALQRLFYANKPLVAVAGPKKRYPLVFAASHVDTKGNPLPLLIENESAASEVTSVGAAFMLIRRDCAEKMRDAYPELEYLAGDGKISWGLFVQMVQDRAYMPEDFSFCQRWRNIGGHVYICPDVPLGHIGAHEFKGDLLSNARRQEIPR